MNKLKNILIGLGIFGAIALSGCKPKEKSGLENVIISPAVSVVEAGETEDVKKTQYSKEERTLMTNLLYGESANQSAKARKLVARMILNRVRENEYPSNIKNVIFENLAISCIKDKKNKNWKQATGELKRNEYENMIYSRCGNDAKNILDGVKVGIKDEDKIVAYHDTSITHEYLKEKERKIQEKWKKKGKRYDGFWLHLESVIQEDDLIFYKEKN